MCRTELLSGEDRIKMRKKLLAGVYKTARRRGILCYIQICKIFEIKFIVSSK
jgi:hypothetical protein